ncbi:MAG: DUF721 domain-containing protein [Pyrinomonadaceae bacterium]
MEELIKTLPQILRAIGDAPEVTEAAVIAAWKHASGEGLRKQAVAVAYQEKTLVVAVADAVWQKQMASMTRQLAFRMNQILGQPLVSRIELRVQPELIQHEKPDKRNDIDESETSFELRRAAESIHDKQLRKSFLRTVAVLLKRSEEHE